MIIEHTHKKGDCINNRYSILGYLDEGGMQEVYSALDLVIQREVALKVPKNKSARKRFARSARVSARVNHPNVAKTLDYFETEQSEYLIEEMVKGKNLKEGLLRKATFIDPYLAAKVLHYLAKGIMVAHDAGVIHRDLKPSNVISTDDFNLSEIKITDFGIAKMAEEEIINANSEGTDSMSNSATVMGALPYMAPEMIQDSSNAGQSSDIWALGAMTYELLSGVKPFGIGLKAVPNILNAHPPAKPKYINERLQFKSLGDELFTIVLACLSKDPNKRPTSPVLVKKCEQLCYPTVSRCVGTFFEDTRYNYGFIRDDEGNKVFFHGDSVYGNYPSVGDKVCFSSFPGSPYPRAHPVIIINN